MLMRLESSAACDMVYLRLGFWAGFGVSGLVEETGFGIWVSAFAEEGGLLPCESAAPGLGALSPR